MKSLPKNHRKADVCCFCKAKELVDVEDIAVVAQVEMDSFVFFLQKMFDEEISWHLVMRK